MYQTDFICTYKQMDSPEDEKMLYQIQLLQAFNLEEWDDTEVMNTIDELYNDLEKDKSLALILEKISTVQEIVDMIQDMKDKNDKDRIWFTLLFEFNYFDLFHNCILDFTHKGAIGEETLQRLLTHFLQKSVAKS